MNKNAFTLLELMIVVIIVGILASLAIPMFQGATIKARLAELYPTVAAIEKAEEIYYYEHGYYAAIPNVDDNVELFRNILGIEIPEMSSDFKYFVIVSPPPDATVVIVVFTRLNNSFLCLKYAVFPEPQAGKWVINRDNPWAKYISGVSEYIP